MSVEDSKVVDAIGLETSSNTVVLTVSDHLTWHDEKEHLKTLQDKINTYLAFIESGEIFTSYPSSVSRPIRIDIVFRINPPSTAIAFLSNAAAAAAKSGISLQWRVLDDFPQ